ncbi:hypothetical protein MW887_010639 [Aspergillus wentii]|nr:hypothetical protein MW887_010639 [Aspergillus wentii]
MKNEEIQEATASEPLTIEEEYNMQQSWRQDTDKLTFITCLPVARSEDGVLPRQLTVRDDDDDRMLGDINLFLRVDDGEEGGSENPEIIGEVELMIAEKVNHRKGFGRASILSFLRYIIDHEAEILEEFVKGDSFASEAMAKATNPSRKFACLSVKIGQANKGSLALFEGLGFRKLSTEANCFGEFELRRTDLSVKTLDEELEKSGVKGYVELPYERTE